MNNSGSIPGAGGSSLNGLFPISGNTGGTGTGDNSSGSLGGNNRYSFGPEGASTFWGGGRGGNGAAPVNSNTVYNGSAGENGLVVILEF